MTGFIPIARPSLGRRELEAVAEVLDSGMLAQGERVREFEERFARYVGVREAVAVSSGTAALHVALLAAGVGPGDEVITTPLSFFATASAPLLTGARVAFADVDPETATLDPEAVRAALSDRTRAVIPVHLHGHPADMDPIMEIAEERDLFVLEDAAQAHGAEYRGRKVGSIGAAGAFSFYPTKNMTTGEGGMIVTDDRELAERARIIRDQGQVGKYRHEYLGYNYRMTEIQAAIGLVQLERLEEFNRRRREVAAAYTEALSGIRGLAPPVEREWARHAWHLYPVRAVGLDRDALVSGLVERGVGARPTYPRPIYEQPAISRLGDPGADPMWAVRDGPAVRVVGDCPNARRLIGELFYLPVHPSLSDSDVERVVGAVREVVSELGGD